MFPTNTKGGGAIMLFPDVCKVPAPPAPFIPVPYPNQAPPKLTGGSKQKVQTKSVKKKTKAGVGMKGKVGGMKSNVSRSFGDEAGTLKGMASTSQGQALVHRLQTQGFSGAGAKLMVEGQPVESSSDQILLRSILSKR